MIDAIPFKGAVRKVYEPKVSKKTKQIKGYKCNCGTFQQGFWTLIPSWHLPDCIIHKKKGKR